MCQCALVYMWIYIFVFAHVNIEKLCICVCEYWYVHMHMWTWTFTCGYVHVNLYIRICEYLYTCEYLYLHVDLYMWIMSASTCAKVYMILFEYTSKIARNDWRRRVGVGKMERILDRCKGLRVRWERELSRSDDDLNPIQLSAMSMIPNGARNC